MATQSSELRRESALKLQRIALILAVIGLINAGYLTAIKITENKALCIQGVGDCWSVNTSPYSEIFGFPISILGGLAFIAVIILLLLENQAGFWRRTAPILNFGILLTGVLYSAYLTYLEFYVIKAVCPFCVLSAVLLVILLALNIKQLLAPQINESL